jgi:hypothetical protein
MPFEIDDIALALAKARQREYKAYARHIRKLMHAKKRGRPPMKRINRIEKIAQAQLRAESQGKLPSYTPSLRALFGNDNNFRSFCSKQRNAIERAKRNGGRFLDDDLPQLPPHQKKPR